MVTTSEWTSADFDAWIRRMGMSNGSAALALGLSRRSVVRVRGGQQTVTRTLRLLCESIEASRRSNTPSPADGYATMADWADLCAERTPSYIGGLSSAIARGWTSGRSVRTWLTIPARTSAGEAEADLLILRSEDTCAGVEVRDDEEGRTYRLAGGALTLVELAENDVAAGKDLVEEAFRTAVDHDVPKSAILACAHARGSKSVAAVEGYLGTG